MEFIKKNLKWLGTVLVFIGILLMYLNIYPLNIFFSWAWNSGMDNPWIYL